MNDAERARRLERFEVRCAIEWTEAVAHALPDEGIAAWRDGDAARGAVAAWLGQDSPMSRVIGLGIDAPVEREELERIEAKFDERKTPVRIELCPIAGGGLGRLLSDRGYRVTGFEDMLVRELTPRDGDLDARMRADAPSDGVRVKEAERDERVLWSRLSVDGFFDGEGPPGFEVQMAAAFDLPDSACYLATADGEPAACSGVMWRDGLAGLYGMATLPRFRRRGIQAAMVALRLARAARAGCDLASVGASPGGDSHRNLERLGFRVAYTRTVFTRVHAPKPAKRANRAKPARRGSAAKSVPPH